MADDSLQAILDKGTFVLGFDPGFPPMGFQDAGGGYIGFDLDIAVEVCAILGVELELQPIDWDAKEMELNSKNIDCIWNGFTVTPARAEVVNFTFPYMANEQVLVVREDSAFVTLDDLAGARLGVQAGSSAVDALNNAAEFKAALGDVAEFDMNTMLLMDLAQGGVDVALLDVIVAGYYISTENADLRILEEALAPELFAIGFRKGEDALTDAVNAALVELTLNGKLEAISVKWFTTDVTIISDMIEVVS